MKKLLFTMTVLLSFTTFSKTLTCVEDFQNFLLKIEGKGTETVKVSFYQILRGPVLRGIYMGEKVLDGLGGSYAGKYELFKKGNHSDFYDATLSLKSPFDILLPPINNCGRGACFNKIPKKEYKATLKFSKNEEHALSFSCKA